jgi:subtilisin family serine protease
MCAGLYHVQCHARPGDVVNISIGYPLVNRHAVSESVYQDVEDAIMELADKGLFVVVAAGNDGEDTSLRYVSRLVHENVYVVGSVDQQGARSSFSNFGASVNVVAPGSNILSLTVNNEYTILNGTSMAAPHVAGILCLPANKREYDSVHRTWKYKKVPTAAINGCTIL